MDVYVGPYIRVLTQSRKVKENVYGCQKCGFEHDSTHNYCWMCGCQLDNFVVETYGNGSEELKEILENQSQVDPMMLVLGEVEHIEGGDDQISLIVLPWTENYGVWYEGDREGYNLMDLDGIQHDLFKFQKNYAEEIKELNEEFGLNKVSVLFGAVVYDGG